MQISKRAIFISGYRAYVGMLLVEHSQANPVIHVFFYLLNQKSRKGNSGKLCLPLHEKLGKFYKLKELVKALLFYSWLAPIV